MAGYSHSMRPHLSRILLALAGITLFISCATRQTKIRDAQIEDHPEDYRSFFLLGNLEAAENEEPENFKAAVDFIRNISRATDYTLLLGNNVTVDKTFAIDAYTADLERFKTALEIFETIDGNKLVLPGNKDWNDEGLKGLKQIENTVEDILENNDAFQPEKGCPFEEIDVSETVHLFIIDTQWYLEDWDKNPDFNDKCEITTREKFVAVLADEMRKQRHKTVVLAMHHPLYSNGLYGGFMSTNTLYKPSIENFYVPVIGSIWGFLRSQGGLSVQDRYNPLMNDLMSEIEVMASGMDRLIIASAHEYSLQYLDYGKTKQIISGSIHIDGTAGLGKKGLFATGHNGFAELRTYPDKSAQVIFYTIEDGKVQEAYRNTAFAKAESYNTDSLPPVTANYKKASIYDLEETQKDADYEDYYGKHYRRIYGTKILAPVVKLDTLYGGMKVERAGGGNQTQGLRLIDEQGREYNMRALEKDAIQFLKSTGYDKLDGEEYFARTLPEEIIRDFFTAAHPYGAFAVPRLAEAIDVHHTHPRLFYVPKQETLGDFNFVYGDRLYMIVEKPDDSFDSPHMFGENQDIESTSDLFEKLRRDEDYAVDERAYIRARIFDMLLGDWDRHEDQWRWAQIEQPDGSNLFEAIPRDRDQVFARFDGELMDFVRKFLSASRQFGNYGPDIKHVAEFSKSAINLDRALLQKSDLSLWLEEVTYIQTQITPSIVRQAFNQMPDEVKNKQWEQTQQELLQRKQNLTDIVTRYHHHFLKFQTLKGTDKDDIFYIIKKPDGSVSILARRLKKGVPADTLFERTFSNKITQDLWIYGLDDDDSFVITGDHNPEMRIVVAGGKGNDDYDIQDGRGVKIFDYRSEKNNFTRANGAFIVRRDDYDINHYDSEKEPSVKSKISLVNSYNPDYGFVPQLGYRKELLDYEANPYSRMYGLDVTYHSLTQAAVLNVYGGLSNVVRHLNLELDATLTTNNYTENFFGFGNGSSYRDGISFDADRVQLQRKKVGLYLKGIGDYGSDFTYGVNLQQVDVEHLDSDNYLNYVVNYAYLSQDNYRFTTRGMDFKANASYTDDLDGGRGFVSLDPSITFWNALDTSRKLVLKTGLAGQLRLGDDPSFYQAARTGAENGLRGYRMQRFTGNQAFTGTAQIMYDLTPIKTRLFPLDIVFYAGLDSGRVWSDLDTTDAFYTGYGGGATFNMQGIFSAGINYFRGEDGGRLEFSIRLSQ